MVANEFFYVVVANIDVSFSVRWDGRRGAHVEEAGIFYVVALRECSCKPFSTLELVFSAIIEFWRFVKNSSYSVSLLNRPGIEV